MSKRGQRFKNKTDNGNINFVFNPDEALNCGLSFNGSVSSSPAASVTGFNISSNSFGSNNLPTGNSAFSFNTPSTTSSPSALKRGVSEIPISGTPEHNNLRRTTSEISFGSNSNTFAAPSNSTPFAFGSTNSASTDTNNPTVPSISFGTSSSSVSVSNTPALTFTTASTSGSTIQPAKPASAFNFGATQSPFGNTSTTSTPADTTKTITNAPATTQTVQTTKNSPFTFGSSTGATKTASTSSFSFGKPSESDTTTSTPAISFGKPTETTTTATTTTPTTTAFSFGKPAETASKTTTPTFSFGKPAETSSKTTTPVFSFGKPAENSTKPAQPATSTTETKPASASPFTFGTPTPAPSTAATSTTFTFGSTPTTTASTVASAVTSTATSATASTTATTASTTSAVPTFNFGAGGSSSASTTTALTSSPFSFGTTATTPGASTSGSTTAALTTATPLSNVATNPPVENKPNPFSFSKVLEDLSKVPIQETSKIYVSLIPPSLANLYQKQTVQHTNFRIDNISSSTRFTELPEQAQKELDELEKYIRLEGQRSDYIKNHAASQQLQKMETCKQDTETLSQKTDALSSMLKSCLESTQSLYDTVREQLRRANDVCATIEAYRHPGTERRWLFGHSNKDDYFSLLASELSTRMEEYEKYVWEIERTAESWRENRNQAPQDIARILQNQNGYLLALADRVSFLHERVEREKAFYEQHFKPNA
ncbi:unnamed protein product [Rhizopus stolonifer]